MAEQVVRPGPFTVERNGVPVDVALRMIEGSDAGSFEWLAPDRWHVLVTAATAEDVALEHGQAVDVEGVTWTFRPTTDADAGLVVGAPSSGLVAWITAQVTDDELGRVQPPVDDAQ